MILSKYVIREQNESTVLKTIIDHPGISRAKAATLTHLNKASVSSITKTLLDNQLIIETGIGKSSSQGGRKPIQLTFKEKAGISVAFDIGYNYLTGLMTYLNGEKIAVIAKKNTISKDTILQELDTVFQQLKAQEPPTFHGIVGISVAIHGIVSQNQIKFTPYYDLDKIDLKKALEEKYNLPIFIENEANLTAIGEYCFSTTEQNVASVSIHSGIGAGLVIKGKLYTGVEGQAGEIGHSILVPHGHPCPCGNHGCLEQYASNKVLFEHYAQKKKLAEVNSDTLTKALLENDPIAKKLVKENTELLAIGINNLATTFSPDIIYLNSSLYRKNPFLIEELKKELKSFLVQEITVTNGTLKDLATLYGGVALSTMNFLNISTLHFKNPFN